MVRVAVLPASNKLKAVKSDETVAATLAGGSPQASSIYIIQPVHELPVVNVTRTVAGVLAGRKRAQRVDRWAARITARYQTLWHTLGFVYIFATVLPFAVGGSTSKSLVSVLNVAIALPILLVHGASLCWDLLLLLAQTFEFWFLIVVNSANNLVLDFVFQDVRIMSSLVGGAAYLLPVFLDANLYLHTLVLRLFVAGAPCLLLIISTVNFHLMADANYASITLCGVELQPADLLFNGGFIIAFFMMTRVFRYRRQIFAMDPTQQRTMFQCDVYFPVCRLVPYDEWNRRRRTAVPMAHNRVAKAMRDPQLELVERDQLRIIDARDTVWRLRGSLLSPSVATHVLLRLAKIALNATGLSGCAGMVLLGAHQWSRVASQPADLLQWHVAVLGATAIFFSVHAANYQRDLAQRICVEIDAWFVSFQATVVALGVCDVFAWDTRSILALTALLWCHWMVFLDAMPPATRRRLGLPRVLIVAVTVTLLLYPIWLLSVLFFSGSRTRLRNRVLFRGQVGRVEIQLEMLSFLTSRIVTLWVWMGRFFWREVLRPRDSFKLVKYRVHFPVNRIHS